MDPDTFSRGFRRAAAAANIEGARLQDLRHTFATTLFAAGVNVKVVSEALGHSSTAFTMDTYQHLLPTMGDAVAAAIEKALSELANVRLLPLLLPVAGVNLRTG